MYEAEFVAGVFETGAAFVAAVLGVGVGVGAGAGAGAGTEPVVETEYGVGPESKPEVGAAPAHVGDAAGTAE